VCWIANPTLTLDLIKSPTVPNAGVAASPDRWYQIEFGLPLDGLRAPLSMETRYQNAKILVVDDEPTDAGLLKRILEQAGYLNIHVLADGREVIRQVVEFCPDLILLDLRMPEPDGFEVMRLVHEQITHGDFLPILVLTADGS